MSGLNRFLKSAKKIEEDSRKREESGQSHAPGGHDESNWIVSYADMMTLLCGFFIMMYAISKQEPTQQEKIVESVTKEFGGKYVSPYQDLGKFMSQVLQEAGIEQQASVRVDPYGVSIIFESTLFFDTMSAEVKPQGRSVLDKLIQGIAAKQTENKKEYRILVEGHTDQRPVLSGPYPTNWELSGARSARVVRMFLDRGFQAAKLVSVGYADTRPEKPARTPAGEWDEQALNKNRRVVVRILDDGSSVLPIAPANPAH